MRRILLFASLIVCVAVLLVLLALTIGRTPLPRIPLPNPNGYDDFLKAASLVTGAVGDFSTLERGDLRDLVDTNAQSLHQLRLGLTRPCVVPIDWSATNFIAMVGNLADMKALAHLLAAEGRLAEMDNRPADAANSYVDAIHFGNEISKGGFLINRLVGVSCEAIGSKPLIRLVPKLTCDQARPLIAKLEQIDRERVSWEEIRQNENRFARSQISKTGNPIALILAWWQVRPARNKALVRHNLAVTHLRLAAVELALDCYQLENLRLPSNLDELATNYLSRIPLDLFSGQPLIYRPHSRNWLLYSIGADGVDDGGKPVGRGPSAKGDIFFDSPW
jgi:hypothetical protein